MSEMVERVAKAIYEAGPDGYVWESAAPYWLNEYRDLARAAIAAMREPSVEMEKAGARGISACFTPEPDDPPALAAWRAMVDAALGKETQP